MDNLWIDYDTILTGQSSSDASAKIRILKIGEGTKDLFGEVEGVIEFVKPRDGGTVVVGIELEADVVTMLQMCGHCGAA